MKVLNDRRTIAGLILVLVGLATLVTQWLALSDSAVLGSIGIVFLVLYAVRRHYAFLVPGMILTFAAVGNAVQDAGYDPSGGLVAIAIGAGFLGIYLVDAFMRDGSRWWPLIPGTILTLMGANYVVEDAAATDIVARLSPLVLVIAGVVVLVAAWRRTPTARPTGS